MTEKPVGKLTIMSSVIAKDNKDSDHPAIEIHFRDSNDDIWIWYDHITKYELTKEIK